MNKLLLLLVVIVFSLSSSVYAQKTVSGQVLENESNQPVPEVSVLIKGTNKGATTDFDGNFAIKDVDANSVLIFSYMGFITQEITVGNQSVINITLMADENKLDEVVVTALNIERDKASLGYSVAQIDAVEVNIVKDNNVVNSLTGKVSGLQITQANTGVDGSSRILLRGVTTISGSNRPLIVVDGIPVSGGGSGGTAWGGTDGGDALSDINPDDVESIIVLKGANMNPEDWVVLPNVPLLDLKPSGENGKRFRIYNFRTLKYKVDSSAVKGPLENATIFTYTGDGKLLMERDYPLEMSAEMCP